MKSGGSTKVPVQPPLRPGSISMDVSGRIPRRTLIIAGLATSDLWLHVRSQLMAVVCFSVF